jgi:hypothetical protein
MQKWWGWGSVVLAVAALGVACSARHSSVRVIAPGDLRQIQGQPLPEVYFVPFDTSAVVMRGDHGDGPTAEQNKGKWFSHVFGGAELALADAKMTTSALLVAQAPSPYDSEVMSKLKVIFRYSRAVPQNALVVTGRYLVSDNVGGGSRALLGAMMGSTFTRADIRVLRGSAVVCAAVVDGKYLGGGFSYGYETLGANEALGRAIVDLITHLQTGAPIELDSGD